MVVIVFVSVIMITEVVKLCCTGEVICHHHHDCLKGCAGEAGSETEGGGAGDGAGPGTLII